jgi:hypothetical protein
MKERGIARNQPTQVVECQAQRLHLAGHHPLRTDHSTERQRCVLASPLRHAEAPSCVPQPWPVACHHSTARRQPSSNIELESRSHFHSIAGNHSRTTTCAPPIRPFKGCAQTHLPSIRPSSKNQNAELTTTTASPEANTRTMARIPPPPVQPVYRFLGTALGASMWFFVCQSFGDEAIGGVWLTRLHPDLLQGEERRYFPPPRRLTYSAAPTRSS